MLAGAGEEDQVIKCFDDITGKGPALAGWEASTRELGVYEKGRCTQLWQSTMSHQSARIGSTLTKHSRESRCKSVHELLLESPQAVDRPDLYAGTPPLEALKAIMSIAASHSPEFSLVHVDVSRAYFHAKAQRLVLVKLPVEDCSGKDKGTIGRFEAEHVWYQRCSKHWERDWQGHLGNWRYELGRSSRKLVLQYEEGNLVFHTRRRLCGDRNEGESVGA